MWNHPIVVAYDGSDGARAALRWALEEAARHRMPVQLVTVVDTHQGVPYPRGRAAATSTARLLQEAADALDKVVYEASAEVPGVEVTGRPVAGPVAGTLREISGTAGMVVLGSRGLGGFAALTVGSVAVAVTAHAHCPVVIVREDAPGAPGQPIVLGVDDSPQALLAADFAFAEAASREVEVLAVRALRPRHRHLRGYEWPSAMDDDDWVEVEQWLVDEVLDAAWTRYPEVRVSTRLLPGSPGEVLADLSPGAQLLVVGSRGRGGFQGLLLGSVSQQVLHHAHCPVAVVRENPFTARAVAEVDKPVVRPES